MSEEQHSHCGWYQVSWQHGGHLKDELGNDVYKGIGAHMKADERPLEGSKQKRDKITWDYYMGKTRVQGVKSGG